jgi:hypothetical protein
MAHAPTTAAGPASETDALPTTGGSAEDLAGLAVIGGLVALLIGAGIWEATRRR